MEFDLEKYLEAIETMSDTAEPDMLRSAVADLHPADIAIIIQSLDRDLRDALFYSLDEEMSAQVLPELDESVRGELIEELSTQSIAEVAEAMPLDDAADLLGELTDEQTAEVLEQMEDTASEEVKELLQFPEDTAGSIMNPELVAVEEHMTASDTVVHLRSIGKNDFAFYIYVVDDQRKLLGVVPLRALVTVDPNTKLRDIAAIDVISVPVDADQEEIAGMFKRYGLPAMPVVDKEGKLLGRITVDDVLEVAEDEATEDAYKLGGTSDEELASTSVVRVAGLRLPWLLICLCGTMLSMLVIWMFQGTLGEMLAVSLFIPVITAMGGNSGLQATTVTVRSLATGHIHPGRILEVVAREVGIGLLLGCIVGLLVAAVASFLDPVLGLAVGCSMFCGISAAVTLGVLVPITLKKCNIDPAIASGPFITTMNDVLGLLIYFTLATSLIHYFGN